jgi:outer membrane lipase/esterase
MKINLLTTAKRLGQVMAYLGLCALIASCGASTKIQEFFPTRIVSVGDFFSYPGTLANGYADQLTVNDGTVTNWVSQLALDYNIAFDPALTSLATPGATVADLPTQIKNFKPQVGDMLVISAGMNDLINHTQLVLNGKETPAIALSTLTALGTTYQQFARAQLSNFDHILLLNAYDLKGSPFAQINAAAFTKAYPNYAGGLPQLIQDLTRAFNTAIISNAGSYVSGQGVRLFDTEVLYLSADLQGYGISTAGLTLAACPGLTAGLNCNATTADPNYNSYLYADNIHVTPVAQRMVGNLAYTFLRSPKGW